MFYGDIGLEFVAKPLAEQQLSVILGPSKQRSAGHVRTLL